MTARSKRSAATDVCREIPLEVNSTAAQPLHNVPVVRGVCVPKGMLHRPGHWLVEHPGGSKYSAATEVLNTWSDGSIRWLLVSFVAETIRPGRTQCTLVRSDQQPVRSGHQAALTCEHNRVVVRFHSAVPAEDSRTVRISPELIAANGSQVAVALQSVETKSQHDIRTAYVVHWKVAGARHLMLRQELEIWPSTGLVRITTRIRNQRRSRHKGGLWDLGDAGSHNFGGLQLRANTKAQSASRVRWQAETNSTVRESLLRKPFRLVQYGSGAASWASRNHVNAEGCVTVQTRGYVAEYDDGCLRGYRAQPTVSVESADGWLTVAAPEFWQQFPGSISANSNGLCIGLFPADAGPYELQGGEQKTLSCWLSVDSDELDWVSEPPQVSASSQWIHQCSVFDWFPSNKGMALDPEGVVSDLTWKTTPPRRSVVAPQNMRAQRAVLTLSDSGMPTTAEPLRRLARYLQQATSAEFGVAARRDRIDEYGWRNFGDIHADHEQTHYAGHNTVVSHYNNQFDLVFGGILHSLLSGDPQWHDLYDPMARHVMDIDVYHTTEDRACFNGGLFWHTDHYVDARTATHRTYSKHNAEDGQNYGGGPSNEHNYTTGLLYYYFLTGNREAYDTVLQLADWVIRLDDGSRTVFGLVDSGDTGLASQTVFADFHGPGRGVGNSINALLDAWILTRDAKYLCKAEQLIRRVVHPQQDLDALHLTDAEGHWSYTVCLTALGRYLSVKLEANQRDRAYAYVRATLDHYGRWMATHEKPSLSEPDKLEYPTEAWAAQDFRKANVLRIAASCTDDAAEELRMRRRADEISDAAWHDLYTFGDRHLTARCLSILMTEGLRDVFHRTCRPEYMPAAACDYAWGTWEMFIPQKQRVRSLLKHPRRAAVAAVRALSPFRIVRAVDALRRML